MSGTNLAVLMAVLTGMFLYSLTHAGDLKQLAFTVMMFPSLDIFSDLAYVVSTVFFNKWIFMCGILFFIIPNLLWFYMIYEQGALPFCHYMFPGFQLPWKIKLLLWLRFDSRWLPDVAKELDENGDPDLINLWSDEDSDSETIGQYEHLTELFCIISHSLPFFLSLSFRHFFKRSRDGDQSILRITNSFGPANAVYCSLHCMARYFFAIFSGMVDAWSLLFPM
jgi:hypothetical protein